jgi:glycosyltransferase involved in cell wall biosynthesis
MRIGVIAHLKYPIAEPFAGGLEMHTHLLCRQLRLNGHDVTLFAATLSDPELGLEAICDQTEIAKVGTAEAGDVAFFREHHAYLSLMSRLRRSAFDVIHNNSLHYLPVSMAETLPMPMVTTLHTPPFCWLESGIREASAPFARFVGVSEAMREQWSAVRPIDQVILNGIDLERFPWRARHDDSGHLIWYGRIVPEKGLHLALDAATLAGVALRFAGPILDQAYFDAEIAPRLTRETTYLGHLDHETLSKEIGQAAVFVCTPRWDEPYGLVVAEALACGTPVAAFARGAIPEILTPDCGALARPDDVQDLARAIARAVGLSRSACRARAEAACDVRRMITAYEKLYGEMIQAAAAGQMQANDALEDRLIA